MPRQKKETLSAFRIVAPRWSKDAFSGEGARKYGGRWNSPGRPLVYLGGSRALCALELLVHLTTPSSRKKTYHLLEAHIPISQVVNYPTRALPEGWRKHPPGSATMDIGDDWLQAGKQLALRIPSTIIPEETNILVNPRHPDFHKITFSHPSTFHFDQRLSD